MFDVDKIASAVIGSTSGSYVSGVFRLDTIKYSWVKDFDRDQKVREKIKDLQQKIIEIRKLPIHRDELKEQFTSKMKKHNEFRLKQIRAHLASVQNREYPLYVEHSIGERKVLDALYLPYLVDLSPSDLNSIFSELPEGVSQKKIEWDIKQCQKKIKEHETVIAQQLSPKSRWLYRENGDPEPYPQGCRWKAFVDVWKKVQARYDGPVNINGSALKTNAEYMAYEVLNLKTVSKFSPLKKPVTE